MPHGIKRCLASRTNQFDKLPPTVKKSLHDSGRGGSDSDMMARIARGSISEASLLCVLVVEPACSVPPDHSESI